MPAVIVNGALEEILVNTVLGLVSNCKAKNNYVNINYFNGFNEVIWFQNSTSAAIFQRTVNEINKARKLKLGEKYVEIEDVETGEVL